MTPEFEAELNGYEDARRSNKTTADKPKSPSYGSKNTMFTQEQVEKDRAALMAKLKGRTSSNPVFDPEIMTLGARVVDYHIEAGTRKFIDVVRAVAADFETTPASLRLFTGEPAC